MNVSEVIESTTHASPSPDGHYIAGLAADHLYVYYTSSLTIACSFPLDNSNAPTTRSTEAPTLHWTPCSLSIVLQTSSYASLYSLANTASRVKIANGSASLGRIASVDVFGEDIIVVWEFGRVGILEVGRGRVTEVGELKTGIGNLKAAWGIRRVKGKAEVLAMLCRTSATDVLSLLLPSSTTPLTTITLPTVDAQSLAWSPSGKWISILDTPLSAPNSAVHIYTADGNFYRSYPPQASTPVEETYTLGPLRQAWGPDNLALANADGSITLLSTTTFSPTCILAPWTIAENDITAVYREQVSGKGDRSWAYLGNGGDTTSQLLTSYSPALEIKFDVSGKHVAFRLEAFPESVIIWKTPISKPVFASQIQNETIKEDKLENGEEEQNTLTILHHHTTIKKLLWHPTTPALLLTHTEDNQIYLFSTDTTEPNAPVHLPHSFSSAASSSSTSSSSTSINDFITLHWMTPTTLLTCTRKRGWCLLYPFGLPSPSPSSPAKRPQFSAGMIGVEDFAGQQQQRRRQMGAGQEQEEESVSEDSLYDILSGRTPLPKLSISDDWDGELPEDSEGEEEEEDGLRDTFGGKGTAGTVGRFEY